MDESQQDELDHGKSGGELEKTWEEACFSVVLACFERFRTFVSAGLMFVSLIGLVSLVDPLFCETKNPAM